MARRETLSCPVCELPPNVHRIRTAIRRHKGHEQKQEARVANVSQLPLRACNEVGRQLRDATLVMYLIRSQGMPVPEARENFREDRAEAIAIVTGRIL